MDFLLFLCGTPVGNNICHLCDPCMLVNIQSKWLDYCWNEQKINQQFQSGNLDCCRAALRGDSVV